MKITFGKNGSIKMSAQNKKDSLDLLKILTNAAGNTDPERLELIQKKEEELLQLEKPKTTPTHE